MYKGWGHTDVPGSIQHYQAATCLWYSMHQNPIQCRYCNAVHVLHQFQQNSCSPLSYCKHYQCNRYTTTTITTTTAATTTNTHKAYFLLVQISNPTDRTQLNWLYINVYMKFPFILWMNILNFKKVKFIYIWSKLVFESLAHKTDIHLCFLFFYY
jgi:hypothetical protein